MTFNLPPLSPSGVLERVCGRIIDAAGTICGRPPMIHLAWEDTPEGIVHGFACGRHALELIKDGHRVPGAHKLGADCGMPGSLWSDEFCRVDDLPVVAARAAGQETAKAVGR